MYKNYGRLNLLKLANEGVIDILKNKNNLIVPIKYYQAHDNDIFVG